MMNSLEIRPLSTELQKIAKEELKETPEEMFEAVESLREWIQGVDYLKARTDDQFLVNFLRGSKYDLKKAKKKIETFYTVRNQSPELMNDRDPNNERIKEIIQLGFGIVLPESEAPGSPLYILVRAGIYDPDKYSLHEIMKVVLVIQDILIQYDDSFVISGQIAIIDLANVKFAHLSQYSISFLKKFMTLTQNAAPGRIKGFHFVNVPEGFKKVFNIFTIFMTEKVKQRASVHGSNLTELYNLVPKSILPDEYGGTGGPIQTMIDHWQSKILSHRDYLLDELNFGIDENAKNKVNN